MEFLRGPTDFRKKRQARYGPVFRTHLFGNSTLFGAGADFYQWVFSGEGKYLENQWLPGIRKLFGPRSVAMITGGAHRARRKLLAPYFKRSAMEAALPAITRVARAHLERWERESEGGPIAMVPRMKALAFEVIAVYLLGDVEDLGVSLERLSKDFDTCVAGLFVPVPYAIPGTTFARSIAAKGRLLATLDDLVARRAASSRRGADVLSTLLEVRDEDGTSLSRETIVDELQVLLFAGHDTTRTAMTNVLYHLAIHPDVLEAARAEQDAHHEPRWDIEWIRSLRYLDALIKESMRVIPPIGGSFRRMIRDSAFGGFRIPAGWTIAVTPSLVHGDPQYFPSPDTFDPRRFLDEGPERPPFSYIPFGGGPRTCIGMHFAELEMLTVFAMLLRDYCWTLVPEQDLTFSSIPLPLPRGGLVVEVARRRG